MTVSVGRDLADWLQKDGRDAATRIGEVLRAAYEAELAGVKDAAE